MIAKGRSFADGANSDDRMKAVVAADRELARLSEFLTEHEARFDLGNDLTAVAPIVAHVQADLEEMKLVDDAERIRVGVALSAALRNAIYCGNLELSAACRSLV